MEAASAAVRPLSTAPSAGSFSARSSDRIRVGAESVPTGSAGRSSASNARRAASSAASSGAQAASHDADANGGLSMKYEAGKWEAGLPFVVGVDEAGRGPLAGPVVACALMALPPPPHNGGLAGGAHALAAPPVAGVNDSKQLSAEEREQVFAKLTTHKRIVYGVGIIDHEEIDRINILVATELAMDTAVAQLREKWLASAAAADRSPGGNLSYVYVDGNRVPPAVTAAATRAAPPPATGGKAATGSTARPGGKAAAGAGAMPAPAGPQVGTLHGAAALVGGDGKCWSIAAASIIAKVTRDRIMNEVHTAYPQYGFAQHKGYGVPAHVAAIYKHGPCKVHRQTFQPIKGLLAAAAAATATTAQTANFTTNPAAASVAAASRPRKAAATTPSAAMAGGKPEPVGQSAQPAAKRRRTGNNH
jgi:ribonuclease HII